jgi:23S rRNA (cytidine1920-2'-O)/16S rRNA (cytidine1409-2'-O)-methyltransferase
MARRLDVELVKRGLVESRARARAAIEAGKVRVNGATVWDPARQVADTAGIEAEPAHPWVSRAGLKLAHALDQWPIEVEGRVVLDVGASTGGFTQVCLSRGARRVYAVDVGRGQLHPSLSGDPRVANLEATDGRRLTSELIDEPPQLIVCDASFIGLAKVLPAALSLAAPGADLVALVKPQFEVGPAKVGKGGVVADPVARAVAVSAVSDWLRSRGWHVQANARSPITGSDGNIEHLIWARRSAHAKTARGSEEPRAAPGETVS